MKAKKNWRACPKKLSRRDQLCLNYPSNEFMFADGMDEAILGVAFIDYTGIVSYSVKKAIKILQRQGMSRHEAEDFFEYNVRGAFVGEQTPVWIEDYFL